MTVSELTSLAARAEAGSGEDDGLDDDIARLFGWEQHEAVDPVIGWERFWLSPAKKAQSRPPRWTSSLDAVVALIAERLPGWVQRIYIWSDGSSAEVATENHDAPIKEVQIVYRGRASSAARSLLASTLRALAAQQQDRPTEGDKGNG